jgi:hypothetical protein
MRNILEYPITKEEIVETLLKMQEAYKWDILHHGYYGDMTPMILDEAIKCIEENYGNREEKGPGSQTSA